MEKLEKKIEEILWENDFSDARGEIASEIQSIAIAFADWSHGTGSLKSYEELWTDFINNHYKS